MSILRVSGLSGEDIGLALEMVAQGEAGAWRQPCLDWMQEAGAQRDRKAQDRKEATARLKTVRTRMKKALAEAKTEDRVSALLPYSAFCWGAAREAGKWLATHPAAGGTREQLDEVLGLCWEQASQKSVEIDATFDVSTACVESVKRVISDVFVGKCLPATGYIEPHLDFHEESGEGWHSCWGTDNPGNRRKSDVTCLPQTTCENTAVDFQAGERMLRHGQGLWKWYRYERPAAAPWTDGIRAPFRYLVPQPIECIAPSYPYSISG